MASHGEMLRSVIQLHREFKVSEILLELPSQKKKFYLQFCIDILTVPHKMVCRILTRIIATSITWLCRLHFLDLSGSWE